MKVFKYLLLLLIVAFGSCKPEIHFRQTEYFAEHNWVKFKKLNYKIPVESEKSYSFNAIVVTDSTFEQRKIKIGFNLNLPNGEFRGTNHSLRILNNKFEPLGEKIKNGFLLKENLRRNFSTTKSGTIDAEIIFHSSKYDNNGIVSFTLEVIEE